jgi:membrane protein implicated in regulation of membrane protease activity
VIGVGVAFLIVGIVLVFIVPWAGIPVAIVGLVLCLLWLAGFGRREQHAHRRS